MKTKKIAPLNGKLVNAEVVSAIEAFNLALVNVERANQLTNGLGWNEKMTAQQKSFVSTARGEFKHAQRVLEEAMGVSTPIVRDATPTTTATAKNRVPFVAPEMETDWDNVQDAIEHRDDTLRYVRFVKTNVLIDWTNCRCCRQLKAHIINANSKPSKARK